MSRHLKFLPASVTDDTRTNVFDRSAMKLEAGSLASEGKPYDPSFAMTDPSAEVNPQQISLDIQEKSTVSTYVSSQEAAKM